MPGAIGGDIAIEFISQLCLCQRQLAKLKTISGDFPLVALFPVLMKISLKTYWLLSEVMITVSACAYRTEAPGGTVGGGAPTDGSGGGIVDPCGMVFEPTGPFP